MYICPGDPPPPSVLPRRRQPLSSHPNVALDFFGGGGDGGGGVAMARWVALAAAVSVALSVAVTVGGGCQTLLKNYLIFGYLDKIYIIQYIFHLQKFGLIYSFPWFSANNLFLILWYLGLFR